MGRVFPVPTSAYVEFLTQTRAQHCLRDDVARDTPPERLLQAIWFHQRLRRDQLRTTDGRRVTVLHPGFWNRESGPDFRDAIIQFGTERPLTGDVEVDIASTGWRSHGHAANPAFANVILHVVWTATDKPTPPSLPLKEALDDALESLAARLGGESGTNLPPALAGKCRAPLSRLGDAPLNALLEEAALWRMDIRSCRLAARARQSGWEQALWEGMFRVLGYKHNAWPMQRLGELTGELRKEPHSAQEWQALLFGLAGFLELKDRKQSKPMPETGTFRALWDIWWRERDRWEAGMLPAKAWRLGGIRPANHPQRRLALAAHWLAGQELPEKLTRWFADRDPDTMSPADLLETLAPRTEDAFWSRHWTLQGAATQKPQPLLGTGRGTDLAVNVILPWLRARAASGNNDALVRRAECLLLSWPAAEDNAVLKLARQRLLGGRRLPKPATAAQQQGLMQIVRDFCEHSNAVCDHCRFPELVVRHQTELG